MAIPNLLIYLWAGADSGWPAGFSRYTALDSRYVRGANAGSGGGGTGGFATHNHVDPGHTPVQNSHTHTFSGGATSTAENFGEIGTTLSSKTHSHASATSAAATTTNNSAVATFSAVANDPPYLKLIFIQSDGTATGIPNNAIAYTDQASTTGWTTYASLANAYVLGSVAAAAGGGTGGAATHTHSSAASHTHTQNSHTHAATNSSSASATTGAGTSDGPVNMPQKSHRHSVTLGATTGSNNSTSPTLDSANGEPPFVKLLPIQNTSGGFSFPTKHIALWAGSVASIPANFALCDGTGGTVDTRGKWIKGAASSGEIGTTGGATTHTHTGTCQPTQAGHTHTPTATDPSYVIIPNAPDIETYATDLHTHTWTASTDTATNQSFALALTALSAGDHYPVYTDVLYIQYTAPITSNYFRKYDTLPRRFARIR
jgi:hypothetical protein